MIQWKFVTQKLCMYIHWASQKALVWGAIFINAVQHSNNEVSFCREKKNKLFEIRIFIRLLCCIHPCHVYFSSLPVYVMCSNTWKVRTISWFFFFVAVDVHLVVFVFNRAARDVLDFGNWNGSKKITEI